MLPSSDNQSSVPNMPREIFYRVVLEDLNASGVPYLVGGGYSLEQYTGISRDSKDLDVVVRPMHAMALIKAMRDWGYRSEVPFSHWLAKIFGEQHVVDVIFSSGNGVCKVDDEWFEHAVTTEILGVNVGLCPAEELIWTKGFIMERERYDGVDIAHILRARAEQLDWSRLLRRFEPHWRVLLSHLILFSYIYPSERDRIPLWVTRELSDRLGGKNREPAGDRVCRGSLLSRSQYVPDLECWGYRDARHLPTGSMTRQEAANWSKAGEAEAHRKKSSPP